MKPKVIRDPKWFFLKYNAAQDSVVAIPLWDDSAKILRNLLNRHTRKNVQWFSLKKTRFEANRLIKWFETQRRRGYRLGAFLSYLGGFSPPHIQIRQANLEEVYTRISADESRYIGFINNIRDNKVLFPLAFLVALIER